MRNPAGPTTTPINVNHTTENIMPIDHFAIELPNGAMPVAVIRGLGFDYYVAYNDEDARYWLLSHEAEDFDFEFDVDFLHDYRTLAEALAAAAKCIEADLNAELGNPLAGMTDRPGTKSPLLDTDWSE